MKQKYLGKNIKRTLFIFTALFMLMSIPALAYGGTFSFSLTFSSDNDNAQSSYAYRDEIFLGQTAYVTVTKQSKANNNLKFKLLKYDSYTNTISGTATSEKYYTDAYLKSNLPLSYSSNYVAKTGAYKLYGKATKSNCSASGNWRP